MNKLQTGLQGVPHKLYGYGFSKRKQAIVTRFVSPATVKFMRSTANCLGKRTVLVWGSQEVSPDTTPDLRVVRVEDGFLRSVGLGAAFVEPISWVFDQRGIYYDARTPSDLEVLLQDGQITAELVDRAIKLREKIVATEITKYNVGNNKWVAPENVEKIILVPGQVEADASLRFGAPGIRTNLELLTAVRQANPNAYIIYKPHPDVLAGLRAEGTDENRCQQYCDAVVTDVSMGSLLLEVDEVHVLTSLAGFEALMRQKKVTCYGRPFYSGWGLTTDILPLERRTRQRSLDELVAATIIMYPQYVSRITKKHISAEDALDELLEWKANANNRTSYLGACLGRVLRWIGLND